MERRNIARGAAWSLGARVASQLAQFGVSVVLARLLAPDAFGLMAMAATLTAIATMLADGGLFTAVVQRQDLDDEQVNGAFWFTVASGALLAAFVLALAPAVAAFYRAPEVAGICRLGAAGVALGALGVIPRALLVRRLQIGRVAAIDLGASLASAAVSVALAWAGAGVWALAATLPVSAAVASAAAFVAAGWRPGSSGSWRTTRPLLRVGLNLLAFMLVNYWARTLDNVLVGRWLGERELGFYVRAYALMLLPMSELTSVLSTSVLPALSRLQGDPSAARAAYLKVLGLVAFVAFPALIGLSVVAEPFVVVVFGPAWAPAAPILRILAVVGAIQAVVSPVGWLYQSQGRTDLMFRWGVFASTVFVAALAAGAWRGSGVRVAAFYLVANVALFAPAYAYAGRVVGLGLREVLEVVLPTAAAAVAMAAAVQVLDLTLVRELAPAARLGADVAAGVVAYALACRWQRVAAARDAAALVHELHPASARWIDPVLAFVGAQEQKGSRRA